MFGSTICSDGIQTLSTWTSICLAYRPSTTTMAAKKREGRLCRWALLLQEFDFTIKCRRGSSNANADALSRVPTIPSTCAGTVTVPELALEDVAQEQDKDEVLHEAGISIPFKNSHRKFS